ncbi:MAG: ribonuclease P protein component [Ignavibacteria bacterium]|nr:ribonuclease P protein component [Ignavibacteria bacterium]
MKKKIKKSSSRNRLRRLLKEAYRLNKTPLLTRAAEKDIRLRILFSLSNSAYTNHRVLSFKEIKPDMITLLDKILAKV